MMRFFLGISDLAQTRHFSRVCVSVNRLERRRSDLVVDEWIMDSGAFTQVMLHGGFRADPSDYASRIRRWASCGKLLAAVSQDYMCEGPALAATGLTIRDHQRLTIERYDSLRAERLPVHVMPVLQGYEPADYVRHVRDYGERLGSGEWVGVGSVCKRNADVQAIEAVLDAIAGERPDLRLHGFGVKMTALQSGAVRSRLYSADSMAWSYAARRQKRPQDWEAADQFRRRVEQMEWQPVLF